MCSSRPKRKAAHASVLLDGAGLSGWRRRTESAIGVTDLTRTVGSLKASSNDADGLGIASGSATEKPVASGWLAGLHRFISLRWRSESIFSKMLIAAPANQQNPEVWGNYFKGSFAMLVNFAQCAGFGRPMLAVRRPECQMLYEWMCETGCAVPIL